MTSLIPKRAAKSPHNFSLVLVWAPLRAVFAGPLPPGAPEPEALAVPLRHLGKPAIRLLSL